jgi:hypothetical protein
MTLTAISEPAVGYRLGSYFATDVTTADQGESDVAPLASTEDCPSTLFGCLTVRWPMINSFGTEDYLTMERIADGLRRVLADFSEHVPSPDEEPEVLRGTLPVSCQREVIFSEEFEIEIQSLPRWRPFVVIDRRSAEACDE